MDINKEQILVVDDEEDLRKSIVEILTLDGFEVDQAGSAEEAAEKLSQTAYDVLITDYNLPGKTGVELLEESLVRYPEIIGIVITGYGTIETAVSAIKKGAYNYLTKPFKLVELPIMVRKGLKERHLRFENQYLRKQLDEKYGFNNIIGTGRAMKRIFELVETIAGLTSTVLIQGETGTGKELIAKAIHFNSPRKDQKLVSINCGAIPEALLESELFGHVKGAFTGAVQTRIGRFEQANAGTIFLDEIGNMPVALQVKLLRVLQEREFERVGGNSTVKVDVRIIAATSSNLEQMVKDGTFREDLYYRLNVVSISLPPLRRRKEDIPLLVQRFLGRSQRPITIGPDALDKIMAHHWPGNVRELENVIARAIVLAPGEIITPDSIQISSRSASAGPDWLDHVPVREGYWPNIRKLETHLVKTALEQAKGNKAEAARILGVQRRLLYEKISEIGLKADEGNANK